MLSLPMIYNSIYNFPVALWSRNMQVVEGKLVKRGPDLWVRAFPVPTVNRNRNDMSICNRYPYTENIDASQAYRFFYKKPGSGPFLLLFTLF